MSESTFRRILKRHLSEFKPPRRLTDFCQHCSDLQQKVLPDVVKAMKRWREVLLTRMPNYWSPWDEYIACKGFEFDAQPGLFLTDMVHFVDRHCENQPCRKHANSEFPCGLFHMRKRGSKFPQNQRVDLHGEEAAAAHELRCHLKLLMAYLHHRVCKEAQEKALSSQMANPPWQGCVLLSDWKELQTVPQSWCETSSMFFAQSRCECSIWGAQLLEHSESSSIDNPILLEKYFVIVFPILDHTSLRTSQLVQMALESKQGMTGKRSALYRTVDHTIVQWRLAPTAS